MTQQQQHGIWSMQRRHQKAYLESLGFSRLSHWDYKGMVGDTTVKIVFIPYSNQVTLNNRTVTFDELPAAIGNLGLGGRDETKVSHT